MKLDPIRLNMGRGALGMDKPVTAKDAPAAVKASAQAKAAPAPKGDASK